MNAPLWVVGEHRAIDRLKIPFRRFIERDQSNGLLLILASLTAMVWANSPFSRVYHELWMTRIEIGLGPWVWESHFKHLINDGLMTVFFFLVGLEIKREVIDGELSKPSQAAVPIFAAIGGIVAPALIYLWVAPQYAQGWAVPTATDIAFALGILAILGDRVPAFAKVFLAAYAIVDDMFATVIIALFYGGPLQASSLLPIAVVLSLMVIANLLQVRSLLLYGFLTFGLWVFVYQSGMHPTIAGVLAALTVPYKRAQPYRHLGVKLRRISRMLHGRPAADSMRYLEEVAVGSRVPARRFEDLIHPWCVTLILPVFALANAGITIDARLLAEALQGVSIAVFLALVFGKQLGIFCCAYFCQRFLVRAGGRSMSMGTLYGLSCLGGIGFTMSIFIAHLGFKDPLVIDQAKLAVVFASTLSAIWGVLVLHLSLGSAQVEQKSQARPSHYREPWTSNQA